MPMGSQGKILGTLPYCSRCQCFKMGSLTELFQLGQPSCLWALWLCLSLSVPQCCTYVHTHVGLFFFLTWVLGIQSYVLMFAEQAPSHVSPSSPYFFYLKYLAQYICACNFWKCVVKSRDSDLWSLLVKMGVLALEEEDCCFLSHSVHYVVESCHVQDREKGTESLHEEILLRWLSSPSCLLSPLQILVNTRPRGVLENWTG